MMPKPGFNEEIWAGCERVRQGQSRRVELDISAALTEGKEGMKETKLY